MQGVNRNGLRLTDAIDTINITNNNSGSPLPVVINEWMADNAGPLGFPDPSDGLFQDWFELFNPNTNAVNLAGFYLTDTLDPQKLYNSARNIEIAAWKLANAHNPRGEPLLLSNDTAGDVRNLSFEREFGKMIAYQDVMAQIAAQRTNRMIRRVVQSLATAVFLPI